jgi:Uma2 family endonuclease
VIATAPETLAELVQRIGDVPLDRILMQPPPGLATRADVLRLADGEPKRLCELVDGVLVEKAMGHRESRLAMILGHYILAYLDEHDLGIVAGSDGPHMLADDLVRFPDVAFIPYEDIPEGADPNTPMPDWPFALAVEVISPSNTKSEMARKLRDYFAAGAKLVWYADPAQRTVQVYTALDQCTVLGDDGWLDGGHVLPGFRLSIGEWFDRGARLKRQ